MVKQGLLLSAFRSDANLFRCWKATSRNFVHNDFLLLFFFTKLIAEYLLYSKTNMKHQKYYFHKLRSINERNIYTEYLFLSLDFVNVL